MAEQNLIIGDIKFSSTKVAEAFVEAATENGLTPEQLASNPDNMDFIQAKPITPENQQQALDEALGQIFPGLS